MGSTQNITVFLFRRSLVLCALQILLTPAATARQDVDYEVHPDYVVRQWSVRDGLPNNTVNDLLLASDGYLWLATHEGLIRFDGAQFTVFNTTNTPGLPSNRLAGLAETPAGHIWMASDHGQLAVYHMGSVTPFPERIIFDGWRHKLPVVTYGEGDTVLVGTWSGLARYAEGRLEPYRREAVRGPVSGLTRDPSGNVWIGVSASGLFRLDVDGGVYRIDPGDSGIDFTNVGVIADRAGRVWLQAWPGIAVIDGARIARVHDDGPYLLEWADAEGGMWIASAREGWWYRDPSGNATLVPKNHRLGNAEMIQEGPDGRFWRTGTRDDVPRTGINHRFLYLGDEEVLRIRDFFTHLVYDSRGNLWIGTSFHGLFQIRRSVLHTLTEADGLPERAIYPIMEDREGAIWVGTFGQGVVRFDTSGSPTYIGPGTASFVYVLSLHQDHTGTVWAGDLAGLCRLRNQRCERVDLPVPSGVRAIYEDRQQRVWLGTGAGLVVGRPHYETPRWTRVDSAHVRVILEARDGTLFFGTNGEGLRVLDAAGNLMPFSTGDGLPSALVRDLYEDAEGYLWIALEDRGLCRLDRRGRTALHDADLDCLDSREGLYQSGLHRIIEDDQGRFWFNTNSGIFWVERSKLNSYLAGEISSITSVSYTEADGMRNREGNGGMQPAGTKASDGRLWFPTQDGVVIIDPADIPETEPPGIVLETVQVGDSLRYAEPSLELPLGERDLAFRYAAQEFNRPDDVRYQYRLEGYDQGWRDGGRERVAAYTNLPPGTYTFRVRAGVGGIWSDAARMEVVSTPFFWEAPWFLVLMGVLFATVGPLVYVFRVRQLKARETVLEQAVAERTAQLAEKAAELEQVDELKSRFLANLSHEFRTPLTLTFGPLDDLAAGRFASLDEAAPHIERALRNGSRLLSLINQLLDLSRLDAGAVLVHPRRHDLARHLRQIAALFDSFAETRGIQFVTDIPPAPLLHVYDADKVEKAVVNLLSNAFKFTPAGGKISASLQSETDGTVRIVVADTGPGIPTEHLDRLFDRFYQVDSASTRSHEGTGIGLALVKELVELHNGTIDVDSTPGFGTRFTITLPAMESEAGPAPSDQQQDQSLLTTQALYLAPVLSVNPPQAPIQHPPSNIDDSVVLVVDDNSDMRAYIRAHLEKEYTVIEAENGQEGLEQALEWVPDLVLCDVMMPVMDGFETCAALKSDLRTSHIPVVLLTARAEVDDRIEGYESGADAYLPKPFNAEEIQVRVRTLIAERRRLRARFAGMGTHEAPPTETLSTETPIPRHEAAFLERVEAVIEERLSDAQFGVDDLADALAMSRRQCFRKLGALVDETPAGLIRRRRLERAASLLLGEGLSVKEVAFQVGFSSAASFGRLFREVYGVPPSQYSQEVISGKRHK